MSRKLLITGSTPNSAARPDVDRYFDFLGFASWELGFDEVNATNWSTLKPIISMVQPTEIWYRGHGDENGNWILSKSQERVTKKMLKRAIQAYSPMLPPPNNTERAKSNREIRNTVPESERKGDLILVSIFSSCCNSHKWGYSQRGNWRWCPSTSIAHPMERGTGLLDYFGKDHMFQLSMLQFYERPSPTWRFSDQQYYSAIFDAFDKLLRYLKESAVGWDVSFPAPSLSTRRILQLKQHKQLYVPLPRHNSGFHYPRGFHDFEKFKEFMIFLVKHFMVDCSEFVFHGSSVSGFRWVQKAVATSDFFDDQSDYDIAICSPDLFARLEERVPEIIKDSHHTIPIAAKHLLKVYQSIVVGEDWKEEERIGTATQKMQARVHFIDPVFDELWIPSPPLSQSDMKIHELLLLFNYAAFGEGASLRYSKANNNVERDVNFMIYKDAKSADDHTGVSLHVTVSRPTVAGQSTYAIVTRVTNDDICSQLFGTL